jgi:DNA-binding MarR family transcriptional regulator
MKDYCFTKIPNEIIWVPELTSSEFRVYATLRSFSPCFAGYGSLKKMMGLSLATISNAINSLERKGLIRVDRGGLNRGPNQYHILSRQEWTQPALISKRNQLQKLKSNKTNSATRGITS